MEQDAELLNYIYQNAQMGKDTLKQLIGITKDQEYKKMLNSQFDEYKKVFEIADEKLMEQNKEAKDINVYSKVSSYIMINLNTMANKTPSHISEMLIQGSTMGIVDITKRINEYANVDREILDLAKKLLKFEQNNVEECKKYL